MKPVKIKVRTLILAILLYTFATNLRDVRDGLVKGWTAISFSQTGRIPTKTT
jgi:hypothetical protein